MYRFSLEYFISLFKNCLKVKDQDDIKQKLRKATKKLFKIIFYGIGNSLFKKDRITFGLHIVHSVRP